MSDTGIVLSHYGVSSDSLDPTIHDTEEGDEAMESEEEREDDPCFLVDPMFQF